MDSYFAVFAKALNWQKEVWALLLQCRLVSKAQEECASLSVDQSLDHDVVRATVLCAYQLVPEAYRHKFRNYGERDNQVCVVYV